MPLDYIEFSKKIKAKYPEYKDVDDLTLAKKMVEKYPEYKTEVTFEPVKKKEPTVLPSGQGQKPSSSATAKKKVTQPSVSSGGETKRRDTSKAEAVVRKRQEEVELQKRAKETVTFDTGSGARKYRLDYSSGRPVWNTYTQTTPTSAGNIDEFNTPVSDPTVVSKLNKQFKINASTNPYEDIYTGYPGKEDNEYKFNNGNWYRRAKGESEFRLITNKGSIDGLNKVFKKDAKYIQDQDRESVKAMITETKVDQNLDERLRYINSALIGKEEEEVIPLLRATFPGFEFKKRGTITDEMIVVSPDGDTMEITLDNFKDQTDRAQAEALRGFIKGKSNSTLTKAANKVSEAEDKYKGKPLKEGIGFETRRAVFGDPEYMQDVLPENQPMVTKAVVVTKEEATKAKEEISEARSSYAKEVTSQMANIFDRQMQAAKTGSKIDDRLVANELAAIKTDKEATKAADGFIKDVDAKLKEQKRKEEEVAEYIRGIESQISSGEIDEATFNSEYKPKIDSMLTSLKADSDVLMGEAASVYGIESAMSKSIAQKYLINEAKGSVAGGIAYKFVKGLTYLPRLISPDIDAKEQEDIVRFIVGGGTTEEFMQSKDRSDITQAIFSISESLGAMAAGGGLGGGAATYASFFGQSYYEMKDELDTVEGMTDTEKVLMSGLYGAVSGVLEKFGLEFAMNKTGVGRNITHAIVKRLSSDLPENASKEFIEAAITNEVKKYAIATGARLGGSSIIEGGTEALQATLQIGIKEAYDGLRDTDYFNNESSWDIFKNVAYEAYLGALGGGVMSSVSSLKDVGTNALSKALNKDQINAIMMAAKDSDISDYVMTNLKASIVSGKISRDEAKEIAKNFNIVRSKVDAMPEGLSEDKQSVALDLMLEKDRIESQIEGKDENLTVVQRERIKEINNELQQISRDAVQEQTTGEVPVQPEAEVGEGVEGGKPEAESKVVTEEGKQEEVVIDKPTIASNATAELDRVKSVAAEAEDGATFNLDGTKYEGGGLIVPVASKNTTIEEITPEMIAEFVEENSSKIGDKNTVKFGIYKFPNSNEVSIDLNVVAPESSRDVAIEFGKRADQESLFDLSTFENVKTGGTGMNPKSFTDEQFKEIAKALNEGRVPNVFDVDAETQPTEVTVENAEQFKRTALAESGNQAAPKVVQAAKNVIKALPGLKVHVHTNQESYLNGIAKSAGIKVEEITDEQGDQRSNGRYVNGEIHIDLSAPGASVRTVYHEAFHHALLKSGKTAENMRSMVDGIKKAIGSKHKDIIAKIEAFEALYTDELGFNDADRAEEFSVELGALLAEEGKNLDTTTLQRIATIINRIAERIIGQPIFSEAASRQEIIDFMNSLSRGMARGEQVLTEGISTVIKPVSKKRRSGTKVRDNYKLSFVKSEDIIDIESLIDDIASKNQKVWFWVADQLGRGMYDDAVIGESHYLDAGPSFALDPENKANGVIWASGLDKKKLEKNVSDSDYIFIISGSPKASKLFNKQVYSLFTKRAGDFNSFKKGVLKNSKLSGLNKFFNQFSSWEDIEIGYFKETDKKPQEPARKWLLKTMESIGQKNTDLKKFIVSRGGIIDIDSLRDDFYRENGFDMNDIMIVLRPTAVGGKSKHSTYETDILGEVVGVPDKIVNASDIMPEDVYQSVKNLQRSQASQKIAPYGSGIRPIVSRNKRMSAPVAGNKLFNEPLKDATTIAKSYMNKKGLDYVEVEKISKLNEDLSKRIADAYDAMKNDPTNPEVKAAYEAMANETLDQYNDIVSSGYVVEINNSEPYSSSEDMIKDLRDNKRMKIFSTESGFGDDPITDQQREENILLRDSGMKDVNGQTLLINDVFRFVHDFFGHAKLGNGFGPIGEENAWRVHAVMYTDLARRAMTSETRGQNSWVNFSGVNAEAFKKRDKARELRKEGKTAEADALVGQVYEEMQFAEQKMGLMPEWTATEGAPVGKKRMAGKGKTSTQKKIDKTVGVTKTQKKVTVNESTALKDQIRLEARAAREAKGDMKAKQTKLIDSINSLKDQGILNVNQVSAMLNRIKRLNLDNPIAVAEFLDYAQRVFERADYQATLAEANKISRRIKKLVKSDKLQASTAAIAKAFSKIDPKYVDDIDAYMEMAQTVFDAVKSAKVTADGIDTKTAMDYEMVNEYVESTMREQEQRKADMMLEVYADMFDGVDTQDMKLEDIIEFVNAMKENPEGVSTEEKVRQTRTFVQKMVEVYKPIVRQILNGTDPFTGEDVVIDQKSADIMTELLGMDLSEMDVRDAIAVVEAMDNFVVNQAVDGLEAVVATQRGIKNAKALRDSGVKARAMSTIGREGGTIGFGKYWVGSIMSLKTASDLIFKGVNSAIKVLKDIGVTAFENGVSAAKKMWTNYINDYEAAFAKKKPNGKNFMDAENIYERGMYAFIKRTVTGDVDAQAKELKRKIKLIKDSVEVLRKHGGNKHKQAADMYEALIDKLGLNEEGVTVADIEQRVDGINKDAVNWWVDTWAKHYSDLYDVSLNVYNTKIDKDMFYTPDKYSTLKKEKAEVENAMSQGGGFAMVNGFEYDKKSGVLMPSSKPASMESQRYVDLNFDMNNSKSLKAALVDIKTAASIRQIKGALSSDAWIEIMPDMDDRNQFREKVDNFILRARNKHVSAYDSDIIDAIEKASRVWASFGAARALAGVTQPFKQTVPLMFSTIINAGRLNLLTPFASKDANAWIDASGMSIANRGIESQSGIEDANRLLEDALQSGKMKRILLAIENANKIGLKVVLSNPDVWIARSAFISYYKQYMKNNGLDTEIDYTDPSKANQDALDYAQHMVDRQQNVSDSDMAGEFLTAGDAPRKLIRNIFFPFATFVMNQKSRMFSDFATLTSKDASTQDKLLAARSLGGLSLEIAAYQSLGWTIRAYGIKYLADLLIGDDEEDEKEKEDAEKAFRNQTQYMVTQVIKDVLSPSPALDPLIVSGGDKVMNIIQKEFDVYEADAKKALALVNEQRKKDKKRQLEGIEAERWIEKYIAENRFKLSDFENDSKYGMYSITSNKMAELHDSYLLAYEGKYTVEDNRGNKTTKYVLEKDREILKKMFPYMVVYNAVGFPAEISSLNRKVETAVKKKGITEGMSDTYNEYLKKTSKKKINALEEELLRTTKATDKYSAVERVIQKAEIFEKAGKFNDEKTIEKTLKKYKSDEKFREFISELASKK
jgi:hypothetical protein